MSAYLDIMSAAVLELRSTHPSVVYTLVTKHPERLVEPILTQHGLMANGLLCDERLAELVVACRAFTDTKKDGRHALRERFGLELSNVERSVRVKPAELRVPNAHVLLVWYVGLWVQRACQMPEDGLERAFGEAKPFWELSFAERALAVAAFLQQNNNSAPKRSRSHPDEDRMAAWMRDAGRNYVLGDARPRPMPTHQRALIDWCRGVLGLELVHTDPDTMRKPKKRREAAMDEPRDEPKAKRLRKPLLV